MSEYNMNDGKRFDGMSRKGNRIFIRNRYENFQNGCSIVLESSSWCSVRTQGPMKHCSSTFGNVGWAALVGSS